eukprot:IDg5233t1
MSINSSLDENTLAEEDRNAENKRLETMVAIRERVTAQLDDLRQNIELTRSLRRTLLPAVRNSSMTATKLEDRFAKVPVLPSFHSLEK